MEFGRRGAKCGGHGHSRLFLVWATGFSFSCSAFFPCFETGAQVLIVGCPVLADVLGEEEDLIELWNAEGTASLAGMRLSDDPDDWGKWPLPAVTSPDEHWSSSRRAAMCGPSTIGNAPCATSTCGGTTSHREASRAIGADRNTMTQRGTRRPVGSASVMAMTPPMSQEPTWSICVGRCPCRIYRV